MELNLDSKIVIKATIIPVNALRIMEIKIPIWKIKCWSNKGYKRYKYRFGKNSKYKMKNYCYRSEIDETEEI